MDGSHVGDCDHCPSAPHVIREGPEGRQAVN